MVPGPRRGRRSARRAFDYVPAARLEGRPHVMVDGAPRAGTVFTLSHWPRTPTPPWLRGDLSAELVRDALRRRRSLPPAPATASLDHYAVDGVVALALVVVDGLEQTHGPLLVEAARVGDFDVVTDPDAARIAFALNALVPDPDGPQPLTAGSEATAEALALVGDLASAPERHRSLWGKEWAAYQASRRALADGAATIEERPELDLAVVRVDPARGAMAEAGWKHAPLHPAAVHSATTCLRVATLTGPRAELRFRYESWVRLAGRRARPRVDLSGVADELTAEEGGGRRWVFDGAGALTPALHRPGGEGEGTVGPDRFLEVLCRALPRLDAGPAAWDPG